MGFLVIKREGIRGGGGGETKMEYQGQGPGTVYWGVGVVSGQVCIINMAKWMGGGSSDTNVIQCGI